MAISEAQLETWSHRGSVQQSAETYETIKRILNHPDAPYANRQFNIFLQGSYGNSTNVWADSDVDIVICLTSIYYSDTSSISDEERQRYETNKIPANYSFDTFKNEVADWLRVNFGNGVEAGNKAIFIPGNNGRRDADVLACVEHHDYYSYPAQGRPSFHEGICFWTSAGDKIINYPKQHMSNCTDKHQNTDNRFKPNIRVIKNIRNAMVNDGYIAEGVAPSYFLEGALYNVPDNNFYWTYQQSFENCLTWLENCDESKLLCANRRYYLVRDGANVCWSASDYQTTLKSLRKYWNHSSK